MAKVKNMERMPHIQLDESIATRFAILPGDPKRAERIADYFTDTDDYGMNREYRSIAGSYKGTRILSISTGMGGPSTAIAVEELGKLGVEWIIRIGSSGALKSDIAIGDLVIVTGAIRNDGTSKGYIDSEYPAIADIDLVETLRRKARELKLRFFTGICRSHDTMYSDRNPELYAKWSATPALASDMETATLLTVASLRGIHAASVLNTVSAFKSDVPSSVGRYAAASRDAMDGEKDEIMLALETLHEIDGGER